ncbi:putative N-acetyltransferase [Actinoplanes sp. SE50]|uniref:GNAT family N-acetyltransferase n=1 Tax=unclassified Actinoplanes TaxID=2626549 RepID=UPI00023ECA06|nr:MULTISPECIES: GNAT family N-acetyltransferase [unclassified Actinoplanes]AEV87085.1 putative N-acetyltransferase [Actinoplanes sp. SE50/110]ATO85483.1 putative N-acetyltransferase [Actinoplanes sp. SE50]SLM02895.1 putative N-acetyltransferase [Actinoplanes sp. SE50/110]
MINHWPLSDLRLRTPRLELRWPDNDDLNALADRATEGVHEPGFMPFFSQWTDGEPTVVARRLLQRQWHANASWTADDWTLYLVVVHDGTVVGTQSLGARDFAHGREALVTAWLGRRYQGQGFGTEARAAMLALAFEGLGADYVLSVVRQNNLPSLAVSKKLGFAADGVQTNVVRGEQVHSNRLRLDRDSWRSNHRLPVTIEGLAPALPMFGLADDEPAAAGVLTVTPRASVLSGIRYIDEADTYDH